MKAGWIIKFRRKNIKASTDINMGAFEQQKN